MKKISPLDFQSQTKVSNEIQCNSLKTSYFFVGQYEMQTFPIIEILRDSKKRFFSSISCPSLPRGIHIISNVLLMLFQSMANSFLLSGSLWPLMKTLCVEKGRWMPSPRGGRGRWWTRWRHRVKKQDRDHTGGERVFRVSCWIVKPIWTTRVINLNI